jgi:hypothetical protein
LLTELVLVLEKEHRSREKVVWFHLQVLILDVFTHNCKQQKLTVESGSGDAYCKQSRDYLGCAVERLSPALGRLRQEDPKFEANLDYTGKFCLEKRNYLLDN